MNVDIENVLTVVYPVVALIVTVLWMFRCKLTDRPELHAIPWWVVFLLWSPFVVAVGFVIAALIMLGNMH